jgi:antitoxin PrlF
MIMDSTITAKGQTTIPKPIRDRLGLKAGDKVRFFIGPDGRVTFLPVFPASALRRRTKYNGPTVTLEQMDEAIAAGAAGEPLPPDLP